MNDIGNRIKKYTTAIISIIVLIWLFYIYHFQFKVEPIKSFFYSLNIFFGNLKEYDKFSSIDYIPAILGLLVVIWAVIVLYLKLFGQSIRRWFVLNFTNPILVIGLGEGNSAYIESELKSGNKNIVAIESDGSNKYLATFKDSIVCIVGDAKEIIKTIDISKLKHIVISVGDDLENVAIAKEILLQNSSAEIYLHINSKIYKDINFVKGVLSSRNIHIFSYYEASSRELLTKEPIVSNEILDSKKSYSIALIGDLEFILELVYEIVIIGQLPNENELKLYIINQHTQEIKDTLELYYNLKSINNLQISYINANYKNKDFYNLKLWQDKSLTRIIICKNNVDENIKILSLLNQNQYIDSILDNNFNIEINVVMSSNNALSKALDKNEELFKNIKTFAKSKEVNSKDNLIAKKRDKLAIGVDFIYSNIGARLIDYDKYKYEYYFYSNNKKIDLDKYIEINDSNWNNISYFHKESNRAVADHILTKLAYLGLTLKKSNINDLEKLFKNNSNIFYNNLTDNKRIKLAKCEHNRWMAFHYLYNFKPMDFISLKQKRDNKDIYESKKVHMCLIPFEEFKKRSIELESLGYSIGSFEGNDMMIVELIPHIVTYARFEICNL